MLDIHVHQKDAGKRCWTSMFINASPKMLDIHVHQCISSISKDATTIRRNMAAEMSTNSSRLARNTLPVISNDKVNRD
jgi:hypothetical protein